MDQGRTRLGFMGVAAVVSLATIVGSASCRQIAGIESDPPEKLTTSACGLSQGSTACASCVSASCCNESSVCAADPTCASYASCFGACNGDAKCRAECLLDFPVVTSDVSALSACLASKCEDACDLPCGGLAGYPIAPDAAQACQSCYAANACAVEKACATSAECDALNRCLSACPTIDCSDTCWQAHGVDPKISFGVEVDGGPYVPFNTTRNGTCAKACANGAQWSCVGKVSWPTPRSATATILFEPRDYQSGVPIPGVAVSVCDSVDVGCVSPLGAGTSDPTGLASLIVENPLNTAGHQNLGLTGYLKATSPDYVPFYEFWGFPLSEPSYYSYGELTKTASLTEIATSVDVMLDSSRGTVAVAVYDCEGNPAAGVDVSLIPHDVSTRSFTTTGAEVATTDVTGVLVFLNAPAGHVQITAKPDALEGPSSVIGANVWAGAITQVIVLPSPLP
jgi:hypothetical protein